VQGQTFVPHYLPRQLVLRTSHVCSTQYEKVITVVDLKGRQHVMDFQFCHCEPEPCTLVRHRLWPATPKSPSVAFHFDVLNLQQMLFMEAQVSVYAFCSTLEQLQSALPFEPGVRT